MPFRGHWALSVSFTSTEGIVHAHTHTPNWQKIVELQLLLRPHKTEPDRPRGRTPELTRSRADLTHALCVCWAFRTLEHFDTYRINRAQHRQLTPGSLLRVGCHQKAY
uniref:Putative secreted protein n=1 Tax=Anopheles marajoara TaxID=58244 RepID=A0A2M4C848_9DIPT